MVKSELAPVRFGRRVGLVASAAAGDWSANRCAPLRCLPTAAITHLYDHPAPRPLSKAAHDESICRQPTQHLFI